MSGLFTVLIAEKEHIDAIRQENKLFFEPFLESKELAFCYWNPSGQNISDSVPGLFDAVGRHKEWRAVIINADDEKYRMKQNPFDVVDNSAVSSLQAPLFQPQTKDEWNGWASMWEQYYDTLLKEKEAVFKSALEYPLQKLSTWLCFRPEEYILNDVQEKQDVQDWALDIINKDHLKSGAHLEILERNQYKNELRIKENLRREFVNGEYLNIAYPTEIQCITVRSSENGFFDPENFWNIRQESEYSAFADRNMYFDKMRFLVFDLISKSHRNFRDEYIRFLAAVLIFISNPMPGGAMKARRLYRLEVDTDDTPLCTLATSYDRKLAATFEVIENEMEKIRSEIPGELTDKAAEALFCTPKDVAVLLDDSSELKKIFAEKDYGLSYDCSENEFHKWNRDYSASEKALNYIVKQQSRSVRKSVNQLQFDSEVSEVNISRLTPLQIDDIRDYTDSAEDEMISSIPEDLSDMSRYSQQVTEESEKVKSVIKRRMAKKTTIGLAAVCLGLYLVCFLPFLLDNNGTIKTVTTAIVLTGILLGALAVILFISLFFLRNTVLNAVRSYNDTINNIINEIHTSMKQFSRYLSAICNVRRGHAVQNYAEKNLDEYTKSLRIRKKHQEDIRKKRAYLAEEYQDYIGDRSFCDETMARPYDYDFDQITEYSYPAPFLAADSRQIEFISSGNFATVPSSYVTRLLVKQEGIYDK